MPGSTNIFTSDKSATAGEVFETGGTSVDITAVARTRTSISVDSSRGTNEGETAAEGLDAGLASMTIEERKEMHVIAVDNSVEGVTVVSHGAPTGRTTVAIDI